jgi:glutaredoxin
MNEKISKNLIPIAIIAAGLIIAGSSFYFNQSFSEDIGQEKAKEKAINYINENLLAPGITASVVDILETGSVYKISLEIKENETLLGEIDSYIGKDGKFFFPEGYNMDESLTQNLEEETNVPNQQEAPPLSLEEIMQLENFVQCLSEANVVIYASRTCSACAALISQFGGYDVAAPIVIECGDSPELCDQKNITAVPTIFINDQEYSGNRSLESFAQETGCNL